MLIVVPFNPDQMVFALTNNISSLQYLKETGQSGQSGKSKKTNRLGKHGQGITLGEEACVALYSGFPENT